MFFFQVNNRSMTLVDRLGREGDDNRREEDGYYSRSMI